jgi:hypothetical protein
MHNNFKQIFSVLSSVIFSNLLVIEIKYIKQECDEIVYEPRNSL